VKRNAENLMTQDFIQPSGFTDELSHLMVNAGTFVLLMNGMFVSSSHPTGRKLFNPAY
jgi:hypothetical protein